MLSRVAERIYWTARYLERIENTARLLSVYNNLLLDLPKGVNISWYNLVVLNSATELFEERYKLQEERNVIKFMLSDDTNPGSILQCIRQMRENVRTTRDVIPVDTWEFINELYYYAKEHTQHGINRGKRHEFLDRIVRSCYQINGLLGSAMYRDAGWDFLLLGRNLERADMTTRIIDAGASVLHQAEEETLTDVSQVVWGNVLRSVSAYLPYRRSLHIAVNGADVARYLVEDEHYPHTITFCIKQMVSASERLPHNRKVMLKLKRIGKLAGTYDHYGDTQQSLSEYLNHLQLQIASIHELVCDTWFGPREST